MAKSDQIVPGMSGLQFAQVAQFIDFIRSDECASQITILNKATKKHRETVAQVVEADKLVVAVTAAAEDRGKARKELEEAQEAAARVKLGATVEAKQTLSDAQREVVELETAAKERKAVLDAHSHDLATREAAVEKKSAAAADLMTEAQALHERATADAAANEAKAQRMAEAAKS